MCFYLMITDCKLYSQTYVLGEKNSIYKGLPTNALHVRFINLFNKIQMCLCIYYSGQHLITQHLHYKYSTMQSSTYSVFTLSCIIMLNTAI